MTYEIGTLYKVKLRKGYDVFSIVQISGKNIFGLSNNEIILYLNNLNEKKYNGRKILQFYSLSQQQRFIVDSDLIGHYFSLTNMSKKA